ncbi:tetratricopeptide repeat protein [Pseudoduganella namucuonensis]|uniref:Tetratricopeptide repeat-containing protein n=1 Tax=Pseudoduganella namucuonensis TaxID=1035707 RepID=A0A1I7JVD6_9BURK|nr:tetratricopeptide repeat protein [Pseudoduganella namucuonensis]SFU89160.1 Tetratricopeptide repeat-containing protein [Pseudoduganella namucuonensis]
MKRLVVVLLPAIFSLLLGGCAGMAPPPTAHLFKDQLFAKAGPDIGAEQIFAVTPEMKKYAQDIVRGEEKKDRQVALFDALYKKEKLQLEYDSAMTRNAAQTFAARRGNCLSLVIMTAALAREMDMNVQFQNVTVEETWSRTGTLYFASGHVNLVLGKNRIDDTRSYDRNKFMVIDFQPPEEIANLVTTPIEERTVVAMFMNNRAAESLVRHDLDSAYWWARKAIEHDPAFFNSYNTLGIIYQHHGNLPEAETALRHAYALQPNSTIAMFNLAQVLAGQGRSAEADALKAQLARLEPNPPFHYFNLGQKAMQEGDYKKARSLFAREVDRSPHYHEFHFWLAIASLRLGDLKMADKHMKLALDNSTTKNDSALYAGKLDRLKSYERKRDTYSN